MKVTAYTINIKVKGDLIMEKIFENMVSEFKKELSQDFVEGKITEGKYDELNFAVDNMIKVYFKNIDTLDIIRLLDYFKTAYTIMK